MNESDKPEPPPVVVSGPARLEGGDFEKGRRMFYGATWGCLSLPLYGCAALLLLAFLLLVVRLVYLTLTRG